MTKEERDNLKLTLEDEGFHYAFDSYSDFEEIKDERFHELRKNYLTAAERLEEYIETVRIQPELGSKIRVVSGDFKDRTGYIGRIFDTGEYNVLLGDVMIKEWLDFLEKGKVSEHYEYFKKEKGGGIILTENELEVIEDETSA